MKKGRRGSYWMGQVRHLTGRVLEKIMREKGLEISATQGQILQALVRNDGSPVSFLREKTKLNKATLTLMLDRLEEWGYVERERYEEDQRMVLVWRTEEGKRVVRKYSNSLEKVNEVYYRGFSKGEISMFEGHLGRVLKNLAEYEEE